MLDSCYNYWNGGRVNEPLRESLFVKIKAVYDPRE